METTLYIQNLKCGGCEKTITRKLSQLKDITEIIINQEQASVTFKPKH